MSDNNHFDNGFQNFLNSENLGNSQNSQNRNPQNSQNQFPQNFQHTNPGYYSHPIPQNFQHPIPTPQYYSQYPIPNPGMFTPDNYNSPQNFMPRFPFPHHDPGTPSSVESQSPHLGTQGLDSINLNEQPETGKDGTSPKKKFYLPAENELLFKSWLTISEDPILGTAQTRDQLWNNITEYYNKYRKQYCARTKKILKGHFYSLNPVVKEFNGLFNQISSQYRSGWSDDQIMTEVRKTWTDTHKGHEFQHEGAWRIVKDAPKWKAPPTVSKRTKINNSGAYTSSSNPETTDQDGDQDGDDNEVEIRPIGQKAAKKRAKGKKKVEDESSSTFQANWEELKMMSKTKNDEIAALRAIEEQKELRMNYEILTKDTRGMGEFQLEMHNKMCAIIRAKYNF